jgi:hypothetical protein
MIPRVAKLGTGFVGAGLYYMHDKREEGRSAAEAKRPSAAEYFLTDKGPAQTAERVGFTATRNLATDDPMKALRQMAFTAAHADDIRVAAVQASAKAAGLTYDAYVKATNPFRGRKGSKPVYSMSLAWQPGDTSATKETMLKAADDVRNVLGLADHQCLIIEHTDTKHPHIHLIMNRVHPTTGKYASVSNDRLKLSEWAHDWERRHGKIVCPERPRNQEKRKTNAAAKQAARASGDRQAKSGYVKSRGLPQSEIDFWNNHGSANLGEVRAARLERQSRDWQEHHRVTAWKLKAVDWHHERANGKTLDRIERTLKVLKGQPPARRSKPRFLTSSLVLSVAPPWGWSRGSPTVPTSPSSTRSRRNSARSAISGAQRLSTRANGPVRNSCASMPGSTAWMKSVAGPIATATHASGATAAIDGIWAKPSHRCSARSSRRAMTWREALIHANAAMITPRWPSRLRCARSNGTTPRVPPTRSFQRCHRKSTRCLWRVIRTATQPRSPNGPSSGQRSGLHGPRPASHDAQVGANDAQGRGNVNRPDIP